MLPARCCARESVLSLVSVSNLNDTAARGGAECLIFLAHHTQPGALSALILSNNRSWASDGR